MDLLLNLHTVFGKVYLPLLNLMIAHGKGQMARTVRAMYRRIIRPRLRKQPSLRR